MKNTNKLLLAITSTLALLGSSSAADLSKHDITLSKCVIQESLPGGKATGAFLTINKVGDTPLDIIAAKAPKITDHVEIHEMIMKDNKMIMNHIEKYPLEKGDNIFKKGGYHIMLMGLDKKLTAGEFYDVTLGFSDGSVKTCSAVVKTVEELSKGMKKGHIKMHKKDECKHKEHKKNEHKHEMKKNLKLSIEQQHLLK